MKPCLVTIIQDVYQTLEKKRKIGLCYGIYLSLCIVNNFVIGDKQVLKDRKEIKVGHAPKKFELSSQLLSNLMHKNLYRNICLKLACIAEFSRNY